MYALVDCNNFYCSCERVFDPKLDGRPIVVLSNNDGCAIARSDEAKAIGIEMGAPEFIIREKLKHHNVKIFSSNYTLYGDMSDRVMKTLAGFVPRMEIYSIDEAFLDLHNLRYTNLVKLGVTIRKTIKQNTGIPVCVGIAPTKTLAKMANRYAKKKHKDLGVFWAANDVLINEMLAFTEVGDIWGVGPQYAKMLKQKGINTAADLIKAPDEFIRKNMSVVGHRLLTELRGTPAIEWEFDPPAKKNICTSRGFGKYQADKEVVKEAAANYAATCALKLRNQKSCAKSISVFLQTNPYRTQDKQHFQSINMEMEVATNSTIEIVKVVQRALSILYRPGYNYSKVGVIALDIIPETSIQYGMFDSQNREKDKVVMTALDKVNKALGKNIVRLASQGFENRYRLRAEYISKRYTTNINELLTIKI